MEQDSWIWWLVLYWIYKYFICSLVSFWIGIYWTRASNWEIQSRIRNRNVNISHQWRNPRRSFTQSEFWKSRCFMRKSLLKHFRLTFRYYSNMTFLKYPNHSILILLLNVRVCQYITHDQRHIEIITLQSAMQWLLQCCWC